MGELWASEIAPIYSLREQNTLCIDSTFTNYLFLVLLILFYAKADTLNLDSNWIKPHSWFFWHYSAKSIVVRPLSRTYEEGAYRFFT